MNFKDFDYLDSKSFKGKILLTSFPGLNKEGNYDKYCDYPCNYWDEDFSYLEAGFDIVSFVEDNKRYSKFENPDQYQELLKEMRAELEVQEEILEGVNTNE